METADGRPQLEDWTGGKLGSVEFASDRWTAPRLAVLAKTVVFINTGKPVQHRCHFFPEQRVHFSIGDKRQASQLLHAC